MNRRSTNSNRCNFTISKIILIQLSSISLFHLDETLSFHSVLPHIKGSATSSAFHNDLLIGKSFQCSQHSRTASAGTISNHFCAGKLTNFSGHIGFYHIIDRASITVGYQTYSGFKLSIAGKNHLKHILNEWRGIILFLMPSCINAFQYTVIDIFGFLYLLFNTDIPTS